MKTVNLGRFKTPEGLKGRFKTYLHLGFHHFWRKVEMISKKHLIIIRLRVNIEIPEVGSVIEFLLKQLNYGLPFCIWELMFLKKLINCFNNNGFLVVIASIDCNLLFDSLINGLCKNRCHPKVSKRANLFGIVVGLMCVTCNYEVSSYIFSYMGGEGFSNLAIKEIFDSSIFIFDSVGAVKGRK